MRGGGSAGVDEALVPLRIPRHSRRRRRAVDEEGGCWTSRRSFVVSEGGSREMAVRGEDARKITRIEQGGARGTDDTAGDDVGGPVVVFADARGGDPEREEDRPEADEKEEVAEVDSFAEGRTEARTAEQTERGVAEGGEGNGGVAGGKGPERVRRVVAAAAGRQFEVALVVDVRPPVANVPFEHVHDGDRRAGGEEQRRKARGHARLGERRVVEAADEELEAQRHRAAHREQRRRRHDLLVVPRVPEFCE
mmetsp:Transcript_5460/g.17212  ORF Transcript_5460/g.17212 Transcript_5460/m.17212 type:complete len:251 (-) Transcript_5460:227-979(-)